MSDKPKVSTPIIVIVFTPIIGLFVTPCLFAFGIAWWWRFGIVCAVGVAFNWYWMRCVRGVVARMKEDDQCKP